MFPYYEVKKREGKGIPFSVMEAFLNEHGYALSTKTRNYMPTLTKRTDWPPLPWAHVSLAKVKLNKKSKLFHLVVVDAMGCVLDPELPPCWRYSTKQGPSTYFHTLLNYAEVVSVSAVHKVDPRIS